jgi:hypothetical protein
MAMRFFRLAALIEAIVVLVMFSAGTALAGGRVALVIGNSSYRAVAQLPNPARDADAMAQLFKDAGFDSVALERNADIVQFKRALRSFEESADQADIAVVYYSGHGLEIGGTNYLIPIDARLASADVADNEAISLDRVISAADGARKFRVIILDAGRDNPFAGATRPPEPVKRSLNSRLDVSSGGTLIAFAAKAGAVAEDGDGPHSPYTAALLKHLTLLGLDIRLAFGRIRQDVMVATGNRQEPWVYGSLGGGKYALVPTGDDVGREAPLDEIKASYELCEKIGTMRAWQVFLDTYKTGFYADLARAQLARLLEQAPKVTPDPPGDPKVTPVSPNAAAPGR